MHLFCGPIDVEAHASLALQAHNDQSPERASVTDLTQRVSVLEAEVAELRNALEALR
jgi:uncharacterized protein YceH (UPF0502 family)